MKQTKIWLKLVACAIAVSMCFACFAFVGCKGGSTPNDDWGEDDPPTPTEPVTIRVMHYWPECAEAFDEIAENFTKENPSIKVEYSTSDYNNMMSALNTAWLGGTMPDVFSYWSHQMREILIEGEDFMAADLTEQFMNDEAFMSRFKNERAWELGKIGEGHYNVPFRATGFVIYYNKTVFNEYGWAQPGSLEEFEQLLSDILAADLGVTPLKTYGTNGTFMFMWKALFAYYDVLSGMSSDENYLTGRISQDETDWNAYAAAMDKLRLWNSKGVFGDAALAGGEDASEKLFIDGECLMAMLNNNLLNEITEQAEFEVGVMTLPAPEIFNSLDGYDSTYGYSYGGYDGFCISSSSTKKSAAKKFVEYLLSDEAQQIFSDSTLSIMANKNVTYANEVQQEMVETMTFTALYDYVPDYNTTSSYNSIGDKISYYSSGSNSHGTGVEIMEERYEQLKKALKNLMYNNPAKEIIPSTYTRSSANIESYSDWCKAAMPEAR
jgi:sugar ABC transporter, sugar-binding protein